MPAAHYDGVAAWYDEHLAPGRYKLVQTFLRADLRVEEFEEPIAEGREYPHWLALRASR